MMFLSLSNGSKILLLVTVFFFCLAIRNFVEYRHHIFNPEVTELDVSYGEYQFSHYISGSRGLGERYVFYGTNGKTLSVDPGGWRMKLNKDEPFFIGYIAGPDNLVVFLRQNGTELLELSDGLIIASDINRFKKWFVLLDFALAIFLFVAFVFSGRKKI